ncbi:Lrp/AsnC family transcriptional regulator [Solitalea koreensis]|uniref:Transcriptional regulator, AsnC family n=1 Tax=Solitalea koreensis TaxID=543615 RepID=A0A521DCA9_9SPHI|nr:Lrp/AsnC family transcriptional regulator [Solitalea koreensis]SMO68550.1 transcriptional regulator, AsnC family [Solitalea koreensis]
MINLDDIDIKILSLIQDDACKSNSELAKQLGMAPSGILERVRKLEKKGVIESYNTRINPLALDQKLLAFIFIKSNESFGSMQLAEDIANLTEVQEVHHIAGDDCYLLKIRTTDSQSLIQWMRESLGKLPGIVSTRTTIVLETLKETSHLTIPKADKS